MAKDKKNKPKEVLLLANRIKQLRKASGYSSYEIFAYDNQITSSQYGRYERGEDVRFTSLIKLCKAFDISLKEFFSEGFDVTSEKKKK